MSVTTANVGAGGISNNYQEKLGEKPEQRIPTFKDFLDILEKEKQDVKE